MKLVSAIALTLMLAAGAMAASMGLADAAHNRQKAAMEELLKQHADVNQAMWKA